MKWDFKIDFTVSRGRKRILVLERVFPFLKKLKEKHKNAYYSCFRKTRFTSEGAALNCMWFKKNADHPPFSAYKCPICEGWHITTEKGNDRTDRNRED